MSVRHPSPSVTTPRSRGHRRPTLGAALGIAALALASSAPSAGAAGSCPGADSPLAGLTQAQAEAAVVCLGNAARATVGQRPLTADDRLALAARRHAQDMRDRNYFAHEAPAPAPFGTDMTARVRGTGYPFRALGENLASGQQTPRAATTAWLQSPGHCRNLLDPGFTEVGVGRAADAAVWVQEVGTRSDPGTAAPHPGCDGTPPSVADVAHVPPGDAPAESPAPKSSGVGIGSVARSRSSWTLRLKGGLATGRTVTVGTYAQQRECIIRTGKPRRCSTVPGKRLVARRTKITATTTIRLARRSGERFVRITLAAFKRDGVHYAATTLTRKLPG